MVDDVARALCAIAGRGPNGEHGDCRQCEVDDGQCKMWDTFRAEAKEAIRAAYRWHKRERRWPGFVKD